PDRPSLQRQRLAQHSAFRVARLDRTRPRFRGARRKESIPGFPRVALLLGAVRRGFSLIELAVTIAVMGAVSVATLPALTGWLSWVAVEAASADITTALAVARSAAIANGFRSRVVLAADSLRIDRWTGSSWEPYLRWTGPSELGVDLTVSNPEVVFGPTGTGWGPSNTEAVLRSRSRHARITVSRVGRVKRWP